MKEALQQIVDLLQPVAALADGTPFEHSEVIQRCVDASEIALEALAQPEQPKVRTGDCLLVGVCASEGHKIQAQRTWVGLTNNELQPIADEYYAKSIKRKHFRFASTKVPCASRIFVIDTTGEFEISKFTTLLSNLGNRFSHVEHKSTPQKDRFCPYVILRGLPIQDLVALKKNLFQQGINFVDGYPFLGSDFNPKRAASPPTKDNLIKLKFIPEIEQINPMWDEIKGSFVEIFDFYKSSPLDVNYIPKGVSCHSIKVPSLYLINEVF